jgi:tetratricopeptide (TPR) repeat protein
VKRTLIMLFIFLLTMPILLYGQEDDYLEEFIERCRQLETPFDTNNLCEEFIVCNMELGHLDCFDKLVLELLDQCDLMELTGCEERSVVHAVGMYEPPYASLAVVNKLHTMAVNFEIEDYAVALGAPLSLRDEAYYYPHYTHYLALGIVYHRVNDYEAAIESFSESIAIHFENPLAFYFRAKSFEALGDIEHASRDYYLYDLLASTEIKSALTERELVYELSNMDDWVIYPVRRSSSSPGGGNSYDMTLEPGIATQLIFLDDGDTLAITGLTPANPDLMFLSQAADDATRYALVMDTQGVSGMLGGSTTEIYLTVVSGYMIYEIRSYGGEAGSTTQGVILPQESVDPRLQLENRVCRGLPLSYIQIGDDVHSTSEFYPLDPYIEPNEQSEVIAADDSSLHVEDGPICTEDTIWWQVSFGENVGWIPENSSNSYNFVSYDRTRPTLAELLGLDGE